MSLPSEIFQLAALSMLGCALDTDSAGCSRRNGLKESNRADRHDQQYGWRTMVSCELSCSSRSVSLARCECMYKLHLAVRVSVVVVYHSLTIALELGISVVPGVAATVCACRSPLPQSKQSLPNDLTSALVVHSAQEQAAPLASYIVYQQVISACMDLRMLEKSR